MAEFQDVMRQWVRARKATKGCGEENNVLSVYPLEAYDDALIADIEENVMSWAAANPEPVYPTWYEFMRENKIIPDVLEDCGDYYKTIGKWLVKATIKHDIAQKMGIEPKEGIREMPHT